MELMKLKKKRIIKILSNGACVPDLITSSLKEKSVYIFYKKDYCNINFYKKLNDNNQSLNFSKNVEYRRMYLN